MDAAVSWRRQLDGSVYSPGEKIKQEQLSGSWFWPRISHDMALNKQGSSIWR